MAERNATELRCEAPAGWAEAVARRGAGDPLGDRLTASGRLALVRAVRLEPRRGAKPGAMARVVVSEPRGEDLVVVLRQPSGALSVHRPSGRPSRRGGSVAFDLPLLPPPA